MGKRIALIGLAIIAFSVGLGAAPRPLRAQTDNAAPEAVVIHAKGPVVQPFADYVNRGIDEANQRNAEVLILMLDTPGGSVSITFDLIQKMRASPTPIVVFVSPRGAKAASAGLLITLAGHAAAMSPDTAIGASAPVGPGGVELPDTSQRKAEEYISAEARSLAERRGAEAAQMASDAVTEARAVTVTEALDAHLIDFVVDNTDDLLEKLDGFKVEVNGSTKTLHTANAIVTELPMTFVEQTLLAVTDVVADPNIAFLLLAGGILLLIVEFATPGGWIAGTLGVICLGLALYGIGILPVNWLGMVFIVLAFILFLLDVKAPTHGLLTAVATISLMAGAIILFGSPQIAPFGRLSVPLVAVVSIAAGAAFFALVVFAVKAQTRQPVTGREGLIGKAGRVITDLMPSGTVQIWGENWRAETVDGHTIPAGALVEVVEVNGLSLTVRERDAPLAPGQPS